MANPVNNGLWKELIKDPQLYVIALFIATGGYLIKGSRVDATWCVGIGLIAFGIIAFLVKFIESLLDGSFKRKYDEVINAQSSAIKNQTSIIQELSKNTIAAHNNMTAAPKLSGSSDYVKDEGNVTSVK